MNKIGLKLWSIDRILIKPALKLYQKGIYNYVELYVVPGSEVDYLDNWSGMEFPFLLHAPHSYSGLNFSIGENETRNRRILKEVESYRRALNPEYVIFHPGIQGTDNETIRQINNLKKEFPDIFNSALIENKPRIGLKGEVCLGASPDELEQIIGETGLGVCMDIGHAICFAAWAQIEWEEILNRFMKLKPEVYHLSDGNTNSHTDSHLHYGDGNFELGKIIKWIPPDVYVSVETDKDPKLNLKDFERDISYLRNLNEICG